MAVQRWYEEPSVYAQAWSVAGAEHKVDGIRVARESRGAVVQTDRQRIGNQPSEV